MPWRETKAGKGLGSGDLCWQGQGVTVLKILVWVGLLNSVYGLTHDLKTRWLRRTNISCLPVFVRQEFGSSVAECFWLEMSHEVAVKISQDSDGI